MPAACTTIESHADIEAGLADLARRDPRLAAVRARAGAVPLRRTQPGFAGLADIIIAQQVSKQSAEAISGRLARLVDPLTPDNYLAAGETAWREAGLSRPKQRTLTGICAAIRDDGLDLTGLCALPADAAIAALTAIKGVGPWTAEVYLLFAAGHRDVFPAGDLALQAASATAFGLSARPDEKALRAMAESWSPWRGVAARLLWAYYAQCTGRAVMP
ncbi:MULTISPECIES: DNA-3-methyladenine glycosylase 2 family protein [unclassified Roseitalea]|uniref:DNA-3-methyladenine glycosylase family protein n=1 Tax=unclassified Roseitalea TaxID=2639107 RepID=UPI00273D20A6|nr:MULTISPECIES: DNA-3-methyladenine glycosylase 2 family protein [unclassified Roseitalea]